MTRMGDIRDAYKVLGRGETEGRGPFLRPRLRQEDNTKMTVQEVESATDWNHLAQDRE